MTSQWMLWQVNPDWMTDEKYHWDAFKTLTHKAYLHLDNIYHSPYVLEYWGIRHGLPSLAELYRQGKRRGGPCHTYKRLNSLGQKEFCNEMFDACRHFVNWDFKRVWKETRPYANQYTCKMNPSKGRNGTGLHPKTVPRIMVSTPSPSPFPNRGVPWKWSSLGRQTGRVTIPSTRRKPAGDTVCRCHSGRKIRLRRNGKQHGRSGEVYCSKDVPLAHLWLVVMGAPTEHWMNPIIRGKDAQWPYKIKITGSFLLTSAN